MLSITILLGLMNLASAAPYVATNYTNTTLPGRYLPANVTGQTFFNGSCTPETMTIRKEWRSLTHDEKMAFIDAELCAMALPNITDWPGSTTRFDDFQAAHQQGTNTTYGDIIHYTAQFLPWHRLQLHVHETMLKTECNYTGTMPWWDEAIDAASGNFFQSDMWSDTYFGGNGNGTSHLNGTNGQNCVTTGAFANRTEHIGPLEQTTDYCFAREFNQTKGLMWGARANIDACYEFGSADFEAFSECMAFAPHIAGHRATGGIMTDVDASPGDPVFYLHHAYLDRLYWQWQQVSAADRMFAISGNTTVTEPADGWEEMTLDYELSMFGVGESVRMEEVMNIQGGYLCYAFEY
ncbi:uncharacterized protein L3040_000650 [Drepanopeziza brunnea f. sp. 'multigermtubi']|uniref:Tyrosinase n=1 Tax=Marssonina brunnea f. sp. multigermtubi (strain MB_m1) TaxID=1072389 RepID=K1WUG0_MARBU|nr:tyrosinase [Drepanopeziza brunnea f. sp. 'multigermtubi' MB_m1]EKD21315.1 tyrosinase [Drepanopeziza brunnea f. sp. 'multigermtubi' MB_m1]KAJ5054375.1 hypothetical protein L3040_000650 [Drepanopeziza brunnea f. sp. 'multigermtubi']